MLPSVQTGETEFYEPAFVFVSNAVETMPFSSSTVIQLFPIFAIKSPSNIFSSFEGSESNTDSGQL